MPHVFSCRMGEGEEGKEKNVVHTEEWQLDERANLQELVVEDPWDEGYTEDDNDEEQEEEGKYILYANPQHLLISFSTLLSFLFSFFLFFLSSKQNIIFCYTERKTAGKITNYYIHSTRTQTTAGHGPTIVWLVRMAGRMDPPIAGTRLFLDIYMHSYTHLNALVHDYRIVRYRTVHYAQTLPYDLICCSSYHIIITIAVTSTFSWQCFIGVVDSLDDWIYIDSKPVGLIGHAWTACKTHDNWKLLTIDCRANVEWRCETSSLSAQE